MAVPFIQTALHIDLATGDFEIENIEKDSGIIGPVDFGWREYRKSPRIFTFGIGKLATASIPGARRLVFCAHSNQWEGFYISSLGGAGYTFQHVGVNYVALTGKPSVPSVLVLNNKGDEVTVEIKPAPWYRDVWAGYDSPDGEKLVGIYALQQALLDRHLKDYDPRRIRVVATGPSADKTLEGVIGSNTIDKGKMTGVVDWAGRGGLGTGLLRYHNIVAIVFGGEWKDPHKAKPTETNAAQKEQSPGNFITNRMESEEFILTENFIYFGSVFFGYLP